MRQRNYAYAKFLKEFLVIEIDMQGMNAENAMRQMSGKSLAYGEGAFDLLKGKIEAAFREFELSPADKECEKK
jgi:glycerol-3-phosphate acyltransferase PlsY